MLDGKMQDALNKQLNAELYSSYLYVSMSACFEAANFRGMAHWMAVQAQEEVGHAVKLFKYIVERGGRVALDAIEKPQAEWATPLAVFENAYAHEQKVTGMINGLVTMAQGIKDHATDAFLQWFVSEQVEEEASADEIVRKLRMIGDSTNGLFMLDHALGERKGG
jgi:ferritin